MLDLVRDGVPVNGAVAALREHLLFEDEDSGRPEAVDLHDEALGLPSHPLDAFPLGPDTLHLRGEVMRPRRCQHSDVEPISDFGFRISDLNPSYFPGFLRG